MTANVGLSLGKMSAFQGTICAADAFTRLSGSQGCGSGHVHKM